MPAQGTFWRYFAPIGWWSLLVLLVFGGVMMVVGWFAFGADSAGEAVEAGCLSMLGAVLARGFIALLLHFAPSDDSAAGRNATRLTMLGFFLCPLVIIEIIVWICRRRFFATRIGLLTMATVIGAFTGFMDGGRQIHRLSGLFPFPFDVTWGLSGTANATFVHLIDFGAGTYVDTPRDDTHQYTGGMRIEPNAVFTQGSVMSNFRPALQDHELFHAYQNRFWGPLYTFSYLLWMLITLLPGLLVGLVIGGGADGVRIWTYENNPHETLAYLLGGNRNTQVRTPTEALLLWTVPVWVMASLVFYLHLIFLLIRAFARTWSGGQVFRAWNILEPVRGTLPAIVAVGNLTIWMALVDGTAGVVIGGILAVIGWLSCFLPVFSDPMVANIGTRIYKLVLGWFSLLMPMCWPGHAIGLLCLLMSVWGNGFNMEWRTCNPRAIGGWIGRVTRRGITFGCVSFHNRDRLTSSTLLHESGHALSHAAYGVFHLLFQYLGIWTRDSMWERIAESHVPLGNRRFDSYDQDDDHPRLRMWGPGSTTY
jgi:hypothetical protein